MNVINLQLLVRNGSRSLVMWYVRKLLNEYLTLLRYKVVIGRIMLVYPVQYLAWSFQSKSFKRVKCRKRFIFYTGGTIMQNSAYDLIRRRPRTIMMLYQSWRYLQRILVHCATMPWNSWLHFNIVFGSKRSILPRTETNIGSDFTATKFPCSTWKTNFYVSSANFVILA